MSWFPSSYHPTLQVTLHTPHSPHHTPHTTHHIPHFTHHTPHSTHHKVYPAPLISLLPHTSHSCITHLTPASHITLLHHTTLLHHPSYSITHLTPASHIRTSSPYRPSFITPTGMPHATCMAPRHTCMAPRPTQPMPSRIPPSHHPCSVCATLYLNLGHDVLVGT